MRRDAGMQGLFDKAVHTQMLGAGFQMLGVPGGAGGVASRDFADYPVWIDVKEIDDDIQRNRAIEYVIIREHVRRETKDQNIVDIAAYIKSVFQVNYMGVSKYNDFEDVLQIVDASDFNPAQDTNFSDQGLIPFITSVVQAASNKDPPKEVRRKVIGETGKYDAWMRKLLQTWMDLYTYIVNRSAEESGNVFESDWIQNVNLKSSGYFSGQTTCKTIPMLGHYILKSTIVTFCANQPNTSLCGQSLREELMKFAAVDEGALNTQAEEQMRGLCLSLLLLYTFLPARADEFLVTCLRKAYGITSISPLITLKGDQLTSSNPNYQPVNYFKTEAALKNFCKLMREIEDMNHFQPVISTGATETKDNIALDLAYAHLIKGAMVNTDLQLIWAPQDESVLARVDDEEFLKVMWQFIQKMVSDMLGGRRENYQPGEATLMANRITYVKKVMREAWIKSQNFQLSNEVEMAEDDILTRLKEEPPLRQYGTKLIAKRMRRNQTMKFRWASAVGKRMLTQRLATRGRVSIMEHQRSAAWAEGEYKSLRCEVLKWVRDGTL